MRQHAFLTGVRPLHDVDDTTRIAPDLPDFTLTHRLGVASPSTTITTNPGKDLPVKPEPLSLPASRVLDDTTGDMVLRIPSSAEELGVLEAVEAWPDRFADLGLAISTGPVVLFRAEEYLLPKLDGAETAPLLGPHNVRPFENLCVANA